MSITNLLDEHHIINAIVRVGGKKVNAVYLNIEQEYGQHHHFEVALDYDTSSNTFMEDPLEQIEYIGRLVVIDIQHGKDNSSAYIFRGVITQISQSGKEGKHGYLILKGSSPTIMLERGCRMDIYSDMTLHNIFKKLIDGVYTDYMKSSNNPTYENKVDFLMQYNETDWAFLQRLAFLYGENLFYSGSEILFGSYREWESVKLTYDKEITDIQFTSKMLANSHISYQYIADQDTILEKQSPDKIENTNIYLDKTAEQNKALTAEKPAKTMIGAPINSRSELDELVKRDKTRTAAQTVYITGKAKTYEASIGRLITIHMPENISSRKDLGTYRVIKSIHRIDQNNRYTNEFEAVPASLQTMPVSVPPMPVVDSILGKVTSTEDPKNQGRILVDFPFANQYNKTWIRVMTPSAGSSDSVSTNRGMVFIPEKGDQVMIGFEHNDSGRPYVMGSMYHGGNSTGGGYNNTEKSLITRSGIKIVFNDDEKSLHIEDPSGNTWDMDGNGSIAVNAPKNMSITVGENMNVTVGKTISVSAGADIDLRAGQDIMQQASGNIHQQAAGDIVEESNNRTELVKEVYSKASQKLDEEANEITTISTTEDMNLQSGKTIEMNSAEKSKFF